MASYVPGNVAISGFASVTLEAIELRVISQLMQNDQGKGQGQEELRLIRNDIAQSLGIVPPVVPGD
jgi:hypothetical protein